MKANAQDTTRAAMTNLFIDTSRKTFWGLVDGHGSTIPNQSRKLKLPTAVPSEDFGGISPPGQPRRRAAIKTKSARVRRPLAEALLHSLRRGRRNRSRSRGC